jgi:hypothetical protein
MEEFKKSLHEIYMNYDTAMYLIDEKQSTNEVIEMFSDELEYSKELTSNLLKYDKTFLKSIAMRIRLKMKKNVESEKIKNEILTYDKSLQPLLEKLLVTNKFKQQYEKVSEVAEISDNNEDLESVQDESEEDDNDDDEVNEESSNTVEQFLETEVENTNNQSDFIKVSELYKHYCSYCEEEEISKSDFKKYLANKWGKSVKSGYTGYRMMEE